MEPAKKKQGRPPANKPAEKSSPSIKFTADVDRLLTVQAKKLKVSKTKYANAAVAYFATTGLDPTKEQTVGLAGVNAKVDKETLAVRAQNVEIGNRLISIIRGWEKNLYTFMQQQQQTSYGYLEQIESNILQHQVMVETNMLAPMVEALFRANQEATTTRGLATRLFIDTTQKPDSVKTSTERYQAQKVQLDEERDFMLTTQLREFLKTNTVPQPKPTPRRAVTPVPAKPVDPVSAAPDTQPKP